MRAEFFLFHAFIVYKEKILFMNNFENYLNEMDLKTGNIMYHADILKEKRFSWQETEEMFIWNKKIYLIENNGSRMAEYNPVADITSYIELGLESFGWGNYAAVIPVGDAVYLVHAYLGVILKVNLYSKQVEGYAIDKTADVRKRNFLCACLDRELIWIVTSQNILYRFNILDKSIESFPLLLKDEHIADIVAEGDELWLLEDRGNVYRWDKRENKMERYLKNEELSPEALYGKLIVLNKKMWILPYIANDILIVDRERKFVTKYTDYPPEFCYYRTKPYTRYSKLKQNEEFCVVGMFSANHLLLIAKDSGEARWVKPQMPSVDSVIEFNKKTSQDIIVENVLTLENFIEMII